ncbi:DUF2927 domain-containing protein [Tateyamaria sp. SN6-1]|uniref:DUF2927 domain-containing protein n=1 Tax=Tateyamaria sp. SN6-1 TaxID=3092148 RepID=UPI0039F4BD4C
MTRLRLAFCCWLLCAGVAQSQEYITTQGPLSDDAFYRLVSCAAPPGGACQKDVVRWAPRKARNLTVGITRIDDRFPNRNAARIRTAMTQAAREITDLNAGVAITTTTRNPDISVLLLDHPEHTPLQGTGIAGLDGNMIEAAYVHIWWNGRKQITRGVIVFTPHVALDGITSVMLEELTQSLGLLTDIRNPDYRHSSIFSQDSNQVTVLRGQDAMAVRTHYAR